MFAIPLSRAGCAEQQPPAPAATITSNTTLVTVPVSVRDHGGRPLTGLQKTDFAVLDEGSPQTLAVFEEVHGTAGAPPRQSATGLVYSNFAQGPNGGDTRAVEPLIIVIDSINSQKLSQTEAKKGVIQYLASHLDANQPTALLLFTSGGIRQLHAFTQDTESLIAAARKAQTSLAHTENELTDDDLVLLFGSELTASTVKAVHLESAFRQSNATRDTLSAFQQVARAVDGLPGRKSLIWLSGGFPFMIDDPHSITNMSTDLLNEYEKTWELLNRAQIAIYPVNLEAQGFGSASNPYGGARRTDTPQMTAPRPDRAAESMDSLRAFAAATGGRPCINNTNIYECIGKATADSHDFYVLGFYVHRGTAKPGWHKLSVKLDRPHGEMQVRSKYYLPQFSKLDSRQAEAMMADAVASPMEYTGIGFSVRPESLPEAAEKVKGISQRTSLAFQISFPAAVLKALDDGSGLNLEVSAIPVSYQGTILNDSAVRISLKLPPEKTAGVEKSGMTITQRVVLPAGSVQVKFVAMSQQDGSIGSVIAPVMKN